MTKDELKEIARVGVRTILLKYEDELNALFLEFPEAFVTSTAPMLARPELKNGHAAAAPVVTIKAGKPRKGSRAYGTASALHGRRQASFDLLAVVEKSTRPMTIDELSASGAARDGRAILPLIRRGYLKRTAKGYVRTSKVFYVDKNQAARERRKGA